MKRTILSLGALALVALGSNAGAQQYEEFYGRKFNVSCDWKVFETHLNKEGTRIDYFYMIQKNCLKVPIFPEEGAETKEKVHKGYKAAILKVDRDGNKINDILVFKVFNRKGQLVSNILYEAADNTGNICNKLLDLLDVENDRLGCDGTYDFKSFGNPPSKSNPMQREIGQDLEKLAEYLLNQKAKEIIKADMKKKK